MSEVDLKDLVLEIRKVGLLKRWWVNYFIEIGVNEQNIPIIYRENIDKYKEVYFRENKTKEELDILLIEVLKQSMPSKFNGLKIAIMDFPNPKSEKNSNTSYGHFYYREYNV